MPYQNGKVIIWHISFLIFISGKIIKTAKRNLKTSLNALIIMIVQKKKKKDNRSAFLKSGLINISFYLIFITIKNFTDLKHIFEIKKTLG